MFLSANSCFNARWDLSGCIGTPVQYLYSASVITLNFICPRKVLMRLAVIPWFNSSFCACRPDRKLHQVVWLMLDDNSTYVLIFFLGCRVQSFCRLVFYMWLDVLAACCDKLSFAIRLKEARNDVFIFSLFPKYKECNNFRHINNAFYKTTAGRPKTLRWLVVL